MPSNPFETAIIVAIIGFTGGLIGQFLAVFLGARYAADLSRKIQLELADVSFRRQWRERPVPPFLELANQRIALFSEFTAAFSRGDLARTQDIVHLFGRTDVTTHAIGFSSLGDAGLAAASNAWMEQAYVVADNLGKMATGEIYSPVEVEQVLGLAVDLVALTARLTAEAARYTEEIERERRSSWWAFWRA